MAYRLGFVMEQTLGQITHTQNFQEWVARDASVVATWLPIAYETRKGWASIPLLGRNWTIRASLQAIEHVRAALRTQRFDALFFHTQVTSLFAHGLMLEIPTVVSMDATPINFDTIGVPYAHKPSRFGPVESVKNALMRRAFRRARRLVVWHEWGKKSLVEDYGAPPDKVSVIAPGIDMERWNFPRLDVDSDSPVRLLFVGGDFERKGGKTLLRAMHQSLSSHCELDIVTRDPVDTAGLPNVRVHRGLGPNAPALMALYARADIFVFPTAADVLPLAIMEAMASGLPVVTTRVGAIGEQITDGVTGFQIPPHDVNALCECTLRLVQYPELRRAMGFAGRAAAERLFDGSRNYPRILEIMKRCADQAGGLADDLGVGPRVDAQSR
jgi:glycosyltransferase involved in cell wall biosynthesis